MRSIARQERVLRESVFNVTRSTPQVSKAWLSISSLASVLQLVRWADAASQVLPISATVGVASGRGAERPGGQADGDDQ
jgi:hypothetical protein